TSGRQRLRKAGEASTNTQPGARYVKNSLIRREISVQCSGVTQDAVRIKGSAIFGRPRRLVRRLLDRARGPHLAIVIGPDDGRRQGSLSRRQICLARAGGSKSCARLAAD